MKRKALGKGLKSLIPQAPASRPAPRTQTTPETVDEAAPSPAPSAGGSPGLITIDIDRIRPNDSQPRQEFERDALEQLARSIRQQGVLQPVIVRPDGGDGQYELIAGERRWRAAQMAGQLKVPAIVKDVEDRKMLELALIENLQREQLNPIEEASAYQILMDDLQLTQHEVSERIGKSRATVANLLRLLSLPPQVQQMVRDGVLSAGHAKALASLSRPRAQIAMAQRIVKNELSVRKAERLVATEQAGTGDGGRGGFTKEPSSRTARDPNVEAAERSLESALGTRVRIVSSGKSAGRLELHYHDDEALRRLYDLLMKSARA